MPLLNTIGGGSIRSYGRGLGGDVGLYPFTDATFSPGGATYRIGPTLTQARAGLTGTGTSAWKNNTSFFNVTGTGIQLWTVPVTATYRITCVGAQGANDGYNGGVGGYGASIRGDFPLTEGYNIRLVAGQRGQTETGSAWGGGGGGGGSFLWHEYSYPPATPIIAAGGGGCGNKLGSQNNGQAAGSVNSYGGYGGNNGHPAGTNGFTSTGTACNGGSGQGWKGGTTKICGSYYAWPALYVNPTGLIGYSAGNTGAGGFGGGGGSWGGGGGGGGYSGGGGAGWSYSGNGGGGGSYVAGTNQSNTAGASAGEGYITVVKL